MTKEPLMDFTEIQERLQDKRLNIVAKKTRLSYPTIKKLADGKCNNFTYNTLLAISKYLEPTK